MAVANQSLSETVSVIAFYGIKHSIAGVEAYWRLALHWFEAFGFEPDCLGVSGDDQNLNVGPFTRRLKKLSREGFERVTGFEMYATAPETEVLWNDSIVSADYEGQAVGTHAFLTVRNSIAQLDSPIILQFAGEISKLLKPDYGIGFVRQRQFGPGLYAIGILKGPAGRIPTEEQYQEDLRVCRWGDVGMPNQVYRRGLLRDVFPKNFLTSAHLCKSIDGTRLGEWIADDISRGTLAPLSDEMSMWSIAEERVQPVKQSLRRAGVIFDWKTWSG